MFVLNSAVTHTVQVLIVLWLCGHMTQRPVRFLPGNRIAGKPDAKWLMIAVIGLMTGLVAIGPASAPYLLLLGPIVYFHGFIRRAYTITIRGKKAL